MRILRLLLALLAVALVAYSLFVEAHPVRLKGYDREVVYSGPEFLAGASRDRFVRGEDGELYDRRSLARAPQRPAGGSARVTVTGTPPEEPPPPLSKAVDPEEDCPT
jgi:hypothetical protein